MPFRICGGGAIAGMFAFGPGSGIGEGEGSRAVVQTMSVSVLYVSSRFQTRLGTEDLIIYHESPHGNRTYQRWKEHSLRRTNLKGHRMRMDYDCQFPSTLCQG